MRKFLVGKKTKVELSSQKNIEYTKFSGLKEKTARNHIHTRNQENYMAGRTPLRVFSRHNH